PVRVARRRLADPAATALRGRRHLSRCTDGAPGRARTMPGRRRRGIRRRGFPVQRGARYPAGRRHRRAQMVLASGGRRAPARAGDPASRRRSGTGVNVVRFLVFALTALLAGAIAWWAFDRYTGFADAPVAGIEHDASLVVERGDSFAGVLDKLHALGVGPERDLEWR